MQQWLCGTKKECMDKKQELKDNPIVRITDKRNHGTFKVLKTRLNKWKYGYVLWVKLEAIK